MEVLHKAFGSFQAWPGTNQRLFGALPYLIVIPITRGLGRHRLVIEVPFGALLIIIIFFFLCGPNKKNYLIVVIFGNNNNPKTQLMADLFWT